MRPTLAVEELKKDLAQYLSTTFALSDPDVRDALDKNPEPSADGISRGPCPRIRTRVVDLASWLETEHRGAATRLLVLGERTA